MIPPDLVLRGGDVLDPGSGLSGQLDIAVTAGKISAVGAAIGEVQARRTVDVSGYLVTPGLIDLHVHIFVGQDLAVDPDGCGAVTGVTTLVDAGSAGAHLFGAFRRSTIERTGQRVVAMLNIATIGTTSIMLARELEDLRYSSVQACAECVLANTDVVVGVKARIEEAAVGPNGIEPLHRARAAADRAGTRLMVHIGGNPPELTAILALLRPGDIVTHCCTGWGNRLTDPAGRVRPEVLAARESGVFFDVAHGLRSFDSAVAESLLAEGFAPDTISSDLHAYSRAMVSDLPTVMARFLALGMSLPDVVFRTTAGPARVLGRPELGSLAPGSVADIAVFARERGRWMFRDFPGRQYCGNERLVPVLTVLSGNVVHDASGDRIRPGEATDGCH